MKINLFLAILLVGFTSSLFAVENKGIISYEIIRKDELRSIKLSLDIRVGLVNGRLPNENELGKLSRFLVSKEKKHDRTFVLFYLPGMELGSGAYATAHHNPDMKVDIMKFMLYSYPQYEKFLSD